MRKYEKLRQRQNLPDYLFQDRQGLRREHNGEAHIDGVEKKLTFIHTSTLHPLLRNALNVLFVDENGFIGSGLYIRFKSWRLGKFPSEKSLSGSAVSWLLSRYNTMRLGKFPSEKSSSGSAVSWLLLRFNVWRLDNLPRLLGSVVSAL